LTITAQNNNAGGQAGFFLFLFIHVDIDSLVDYTAVKMRCIVLSYAFKSLIKKYGDVR